MFCFFLKGNLKVLQGFNEKMQDFDMFREVFLRNTRLFKEFRKVIAEMLRLQKKNCENYKKNAKKIEENAEKVQENAGKSLKLQKISEEMLRNFKKNREKSHKSQFFCENSAFLQAKRSSFTGLLQNPAISAENPRLFSSCPSFLQFSKNL